VLKYECACSLLMPHTPGSLNPRIF
jgi:hypothetical protein